MCLPFVTGVADDLGVTEFQSPIRPHVKGDDVVDGARWFQASLLNAGLAEIAVALAAFFSDPHPVVVVATLGRGAAPAFGGTVAAVFGMFLAEPGACEVGTTRMVAGGFQSLGHSRAPLLASSYSILRR